MRHIILGTAGHIDHGKSSLVKALTGIDPDRLKEEKERGITIDIGFADLIYKGSGLTVGIVDVPGHEKLIRNMLAGAGGIDMVLLVIAADEGIMPQSREHLAICDLLKIQSGLIAVTKSDLVQKDWIDLVKEEIGIFAEGTFLEGAPIIPVSSRTGENLDLLKAAIKEIALKIAPKDAEGLFRLPIDRVFSLRGFGTVITGTAISGVVSPDETVEILPAGLITKVRGLHSHGRAIDKAYAGQRVAINLQGVEKESLSRGDVVVTPSSFVATRSVDAFLELLPGAPPLKNRSLIHLYVGTAETVARLVLYDTEELKPGSTCYCQFRLQDPVIAVAGDRYIVRRFSPLETLGGGVVLDPSPSRRRRREGTTDLSVLHTGSLAQKISLKIEKSGSRGMSVAALQAWLKAQPKAIEEALKKLLEAGEVLQFEDQLFHKGAFSALRDGVVGMLRDFHKKNPLKGGMSKEELRNQLKIDARIFNFVLAERNNIVVEKDLVRLTEFKVALSSSEEGLSSKIIDMLEQGGFQPPLREDIAALVKLDQKRLGDIMGLLAKEKRIVRISESLYLSARFYREMISRVHAFFAKKPDMTVAEFRDLLNTSRKYALPLIEHLDSGKITIRTGDVRKLLAKKIIP